MLHQRISNILICVHHANSDITSINDFVDEMINHSTCLDFLCDLGSFACAVSPLLSQ
jgi:hypothetical protein